MTNPTPPGQQRDVARSVALGQPMGHGPNQVAGHLGAQGDKLLTVAERNIRSFLRSAIFKSESDREAALNCVDVLWEAARAPAESVQDMQSVNDAVTIELPPLPDPDLRDVGTKPQDVKDFLNGYATEYARLALAARTPAESVGRDAERLDFLIEQRAYVVSDPDACPGYWLNFVHKETGKRWVQADEHPTPRAAIDAAMAASRGNK